MGEERITICVESSSRDISVDVDFGGQILSGQLQISIDNVDDFAAQATSTFIEKVGLDEVRKLISDSYTAKNYICSDKIKEILSRFDWDIEERFVLDIKARLMVSVGNGDDCVFGTLYKKSAYDKSLSGEDALREFIAKTVRYELEREDKPVEQLVLKFDRKGSRIMWMPKEE